MSHRFRNDDHSVDEPPAEIVMSSVMSSYCVATPIK